jgi:hypothetical protein
MDWLMKPTLLYELIYLHFSQNYLSSGVVWLSLESTCFSSNDGFNLDPILNQTGGMIVDS